jgi:hypothetical protein
VTLSPTTVRRTQSGTKPSSIQGLTAGPRRCHSPPRAGGAGQRDFSYDNSETGTLTLAGIRDSCPGSLPRAQSACWLAAHGTQAPQPYTDVHGFLAGATQIADQAHLLRKAPAPLRQVTRSLGSSDVDMMIMSRQHPGRNSRESTAIRCIPTPSENRREMGVDKGRCTALSSDTRSCRMPFDGFLNHVCLALSC